MRWIWMIGLVVVFAQKIVSRTHIEVEGYSVEKVGLPQSPVSIGKNRFAFVEYFVQGKLKPKTGWYLECLDTEYAESWSVLLEVPPAGAERPVRLIRMANALLALSYEADPLQKGVNQEVARFYSLRGQPLLPKWTAISVYDRPTSAEGNYSLSPDSTYLLWYAQEVDKKGQAFRTWYAVWSENARKVASETDWNPGGRLLAAYPDQKARIWALVLPPQQRVPVLTFYDPKARQSRTWPLGMDSVWVFPTLHLSRKAVWLTAFAPDKKQRPTEEGPIGAWRVAYLPQTFIDSIKPLVAAVALPEALLTAAKDPIRPQLTDWWHPTDSTLFLIWEDRRERGGTAMADEIWATRWDLASDSLRLTWSYVIEKRQREPLPEAVGFFSGLSETFLTILYLTERTGRGVLRAYQINRQTGEALSKDIAPNTAGDLILLPGRQARLSERETIILALGRPGKNGYQIFHIRL